ncbi:hypothetical protein BGZ63DRAFT_424443 [Mariannaea sp. PMI_226]|nr:hypothetical protein BGZ63DRAFT_424443 [Mariannaea sp. PMI_226]
MHCLRTAVGAATKRSRLPLEVVALGCRFEGGRSKRCTQCAGRTNTCKPAAAGMAADVRDLVALLGFLRWLVVDDQLKGRVRYLHRRWSPTEAIRNTLNGIITSLSDNLMTVVTTGLSELIATRFVKAPPKMMINGAVYQRLAIASTDPNNIVLTTPSLRLARRLKDLRAGCGASKHGLSLEEMLPPPPPADNKQSPHP